MNALLVVTRREGRVQTLADTVETGDPGTTWFRTVGRHEIDRAYRLAGFLLADAREAEDATQDALARAWRQRSSLRNLESAQAWFDRVLVNVCRDRLRRRRPRVGWADVDESVPSPAADPFAALLARDAVLGAVAALPVDQRIVLVLRYWADLPVDGIADRLGVPAGTVKSRLYYAMRTLRTALEDRA